MQQCQQSVPDCPADNDQAVPFNIQIRIAMHRNPPLYGPYTLLKFQRGFARPVQHFGSSCFVDYSLWSEDSIVYMHTHSEGDALPLSLVNTALVLLRCHALRQRVHRIHIRVRKRLLHAASRCRGQRSQARCRGKGLRRRPQRYELAQGCVYARSRGSTGRLGHCGEHVSFCRCRSHVAGSRE